MDAAPDAFAAVDTDLNVIRWNDAAQRLTGFTRDEVLGHPLPHLTTPQQQVLRRSLATPPTGLDDLPMVVGWRDRSGGTLQVSLTTRVPLVDAEGRRVGVGYYFHAVRPSDAGTHVRNVYSRRLAGSLRTEEVLEALETILVEVLPAARGYLLRRRHGAWGGWLAVGDHREVAEGVVVPRPEPLDDAVREGASRRATIVIGGQDTAVLLVPSGPAEAATVLALVEADGAEEELLIALAAEAWAALRRVEAIDDLEGKLEILEAIAGVAAATGLDTTSVVSHVTRHAAGALSCERAALYLRQPDGRLALTAFHAADRDWTVEDDIQQAGGQAVAEMAADMLSGVEPFLAQDTRACPWLAGPWDHDEGAVSVYGMPLTLGDREVGVLVVAHTNANPRGFTSLCTQVGAAMSRQAALAISNALLYDAQREVAERFRQLDQQRADWVAGVTHDLRTPVTAIVGFAGTLRRSGSRMSVEERDEALDVISRQSVRVSRMLDDMMDQALAQADELKPERRVAVSLNGCVADAVSVCSEPDRKRLDVVARTDLVVCGDVGQMTRVVQNLVVNALRHTPEDTTVTIDVVPEDGRGLVVVTDHGQGLPEDLELFAPFARGPRGGTGMGLYTVKRIVELHGGTIILRPTPGGGTTVTVGLPLSDGADSC